MRRLKRRSYWKKGKNWGQCRRSKLPNIIEGPDLEKRVFWSMSFWYKRKRRKNTDITNFMFLICTVCMCVFFFPQPLLSYTHITQPLHTLFPGAWNIVPISLCLVNSHSSFTSQLNLLQSSLGTAYLSTISIRLD